MKSTASKPAAMKRSTPLSQQALSSRNLHCIYSRQKIQKRVRELADQINQDYEGKTLHVVGILEDCFIFMADLIRSLNVPVVCHFMKAEMHDTSAGAVATREIIYTPKIEAAGRDVLLVCGILESGLTLDYLYQYFLGQGSSSVRTVSFIEKSDARTVDVTTDYVGFKDAEGFLVGYGLGYHENFRNLPFVARLSRAVSSI